MQLGERFSLFFKILFPLLFLFAAAIHPSSIAVMDSQRQVRAALQEDNPRVAAEALRRVVQQEPWRTTLWEQIGRKELDAARLVEGIAALRSADALGELSPEGRFLLAEAYYELGNKAAAAHAWQTLLNDPAQLAENTRKQVWERLAQYYREEKDYVSAVELLRAWHKFDPQNTRALYLLGLHLTVFHPEEALPYLTQSAQLDTAYRGEVQVLRRGLNLAANVEPADAGYQWITIGRALGSANQWDLAAEAFRQAAATSPQYAEAWAFWGEALQHLGEDGKVELDRAYQINPESPVVRALLSLFWRRQGDTEQALTFLLAVARQEPTEPAWQVEIGNTLIEQGDLIAAREHFEKAVELAPQTSLYWQHLARFSIQYEMDVPSLGLPAARKAVLLAPEDPSALDVMGWTMVYLSDYASAERFLQQAVERNATYTPALLHLGQLYLEKQDQQRAYLYLKRAANLAGEDSVGVTARRLLVAHFGEGN